jgi:hypothetical protein
MLSACAGGAPPAPGAAAAVATPVRAVRSGPAAIDTMTLRRVARTLSDDRFEGRGTGTPGAELAAEYLAEECRRLGLVPVDGQGWFQTVPLTDAHVDSVGSVVRVTGPGKDTTFVYWEEFIPDVGTSATLRDFAGPLAYVGRAPDILFRRSDLPDLTGTIALLRGEFGASGDAADTLFARGAVGVIEVVDDANRYRLFRQTRGRSRLSVSDTAVRSSFIPPLPVVMAGPRMTVTLYEPLTGVTHGSWNDAYLNGLAAGLPSPQRLPGWRAEVQVRTTTRARTSRNVACLLPGIGTAADTAIAITAHYDHLGIGVPDARRDSIYNGFSDNATGVAMALGVAEALQAERAGGRGVRHSVLLLFFTGEEQGLLGSDYWVTHPRWPLARTAGVINLDANAPAGRPTDWRVAGDDGTALVQLVMDEMGRRQWTATPAPPAPGSDYYPFVRRGIPAVFYVPSNGQYEGLSVTQSDSMRASVWSRYHRADDEYRESFPFEGLARYAEFTRDVVRAWDDALSGRRAPTAATRSGRRTSGASEE